MDAMVVMDDRILILELKDLHGSLVHNGDIWINKRRRFRSPVQLLAMKARKLKSFLVANIPQFPFYVDFRVVLTGSATKQDLAISEQPSVWTLQEACSIATSAGKRALLNNTRLHAKKAFALEQDFERLTLNPKMFGPLEAEWDGYRVVEEKFVTHPAEIWSEHLAEQISDARFKALLRIWAFDKLPPGLNSPEQRQFIASRELRAIGRLHELGSNLLDRNAILAPFGEEKDEILTQHFELRRLTSGLTTLDRYLQRASEDLSLDDRITQAATLMEIVSELHSQGIVHRDLGLRAIWASSPTRVALGGLMSCQLPDEQSLGDWSPLLRGYADRLPEDVDKSLAGTGEQRDVYALGGLTFRILTDAEPPAQPAEFASRLPASLPDLTSWFNRAIVSDANMRFANAREMADAFAVAVEPAKPQGIDQTLIDRHEVSDVPYVLWPFQKKLNNNGSTYVGVDSDANQIVVKTWPEMRRGINTASDLALTRLFDGVGRLISSPQPGLPRYIRAGLAPTGPFAIYRFIEGTSLVEATPKDLDTVLRYASRLVQCVTALHAMGHTHGDIAQKNIIVCDDGADVCLLDLFDMTLLADGRVRTPVMCPDNRDALTDEQLDRYAVTRVVRELLASVEDADIATDVAQLDQELQRHRLETIEPISSILRNIVQRIEVERPPQVQVSFRGGGRGDFHSDDGSYYLRADKVDATTTLYRIFGIERELTLEVRKDEIVDVRYLPANFTHLSNASQHGVAVKLQIAVTEGVDAGLADLLAFLKPLVGPPVLDAELTDIGEHRALDVPRYWTKVLDLEESLQPQVEILEDLGELQGGTSVYAYERQGQDFDFDTATTVDVLLQNGRRAGEVNLEQTDAQRLVVDFSDRRLVAGDRITLVDRKSRSSYDRRRKAVDRILDDDAAIERLIDYFEPGHSLSAVDFGYELSDEVLDQYELNRGQRNAFRHVVRFGPVGLLQGPPGTGKTHFIASLVHWLTTVQGAQKILVASQSHEAVNNVIETLLNLFKKIGGRRPSLLRIGSKGITDKIRPYHTTSLQEQFHARFENAIRHRIAGLASAIGLKRALAMDAVDIDRNVVERARRLKTLAEAERGSARLPRSEQRQLGRSIAVAANAFSIAAAQILGRAADPAHPDAEIDSTFEALFERHPDTSPSDLAKVRQLIELSRDWSAALANPRRNFEEFLAKTRTIVTATCVGVGQTKIRLEKIAFDWVIVDEAARCTPGELAVPIQLGRRVLLVGDHRQLLPMTSRGVLKGLRAEMPETLPHEFDRSDFERAYLSQYGQDNGRTLTEQYRMAPPICDLVSRIFYEPHGVKLRTSDRRLANGAFTVPMERPLAAVVTWIDTSKEQNHLERPAPWDRTTFSNDAEAEAIMRLLERIAANDPLVQALAAGKSETPIGIISMYSAQKIKIAEAFARRPWDSRFRKLVRIDTVDSYQGKENDIVIVSLVRCNRAGDQGHVRIPNRCNVALSRAKERLFVVGSTAMWNSVVKRGPMRQVYEGIVGGGGEFDVIRAGEL